MKQTPLKRKAPLAVDPNKVREFLRRARENSDLSRGQPLKPSPPKQRARIPNDARKRVYARNGGRCIVCGKRGPLTVHHVLSVERWPTLELVEDNMVGVHWSPCHAAHENASRRIRWQELPECAIRLAHTTSGAAVLELERRYPR